EGDCRLAVMEDEPVVLAELDARADGLQRRALAAGDDRQLERVVEAQPAACVALGDDAAALVDERQRAAEVRAEDREQRVEPAALEHGLRQPLVHLERARQPLELLVREVRERRSRDRDERHLVRDAEDREGTALRLGRDRRRHLHEAEADAEAQAGDAVVSEPAHVRALAARRLTDAEAGRQQELAALEEACRVGELGAVQPGDLVVEAAGARRDAQLQVGQVGDVPDRQHVDSTAGTNLRESPTSRKRQEGEPCRRNLYRMSKNPSYVPPRRLLPGQRRSGTLAPMALSELTAGEKVLEARERYVARGVSTTTLVVARAEGARIWDADGRRYLDFAGGIACQNTGHRFGPVTAAIRDQLDRYLHQCFMVGVYEPYVEVCRRLAEL